MNLELFKYHMIMISVPNHINLSKKAFEARAFNQAVLRAIDTELKARKTGSKAEYEIKVADKWRIVADADGVCAHPITN
jgi:hypothetical protein